MSLSARAILANEEIRNELTHFEAQSTSLAAMFKTKLERSVSSFASHWISQSIQRSIQVKADAEQRAKDDLEAVKAQKRKLEEKDRKKQAKAEKKERREAAKAAAAAAARSGEETEGADDEKKGTVVKFEPEKTVTPEKAASPPGSPKLGETSPNPPASVRSSGGGDKEGSQLAGGNAGADEKNALCKTAKTRGDRLRIRIWLGCFSSLKS